MKRMAISKTTRDNHTRYDSQTDLITTRTLADGRVLKTQRTDAQHGATVQTLQLQRAWAAWVQGKMEQLLGQSAANIVAQLMPAQSIASNITIDPFDGLQQRVSKTANGKTTFFLWQQGKLVAEVNAQGQIKAQYLYMSEGQGASPIAKLEKGRTYHVHNDHRATPVAMTDDKQQIVWQAPKANAWGRVKVSESASNQVELNIRLPGQYFDAETGLHYNRQRYYDPAQGQYLTPDPLGQPDGPNPYAYVAFNPLSNIDPDGLILFAFDGTLNTEIPPAGDSISNLKKLCEWVYQIHCHGNASKASCSQPPCAPSRTRMAC